MSRFTAPLVVTPTDDYKRWIVLESTNRDLESVTTYDVGTRSITFFGYDIGEEGSGLSIIVPTQFETDFASIPWFARWLIKTWGRHTNPAIIHDYLYRGGKVNFKSDFGKPVKVPKDLLFPMSRKNADQIMLEAMEVMNVRKWRRLVIYYGLRIGGGFAWRRLRKQKTNA